MSHRVFLSWFSSVLLLALGAAGCGGGADGAGRGGGGGRGGPGGPGGMPPMPVETATVASADLLDRFETIGTLEATDAITVVSEIDGAVVSLPFTEGDRVGKGTVLAKLDDSQLKAEYDRAAALRDQTRISHDRIAGLVEQRAAAAQDLDDAAAALKVAEANLALAKSRLDKTRITAPFAGTVGSRRVSVGTFLRSGEVITELAQLDELRAVFHAPERVLGELKRGAEVSISTVAYPGLELKGTILVVESVLDPQTRTARVVARVPNAENQFRPGMSANVSSVLSRHVEAVTVPNEAVFVEGNQSYVYLVKPDSTVTKTPLRLGSRRADVVQVLEGVASGARVVRAGHQKLFEGAKVMPIPSGGAPGTPGGPGTQRAPGTPGGPGAPDESGALGQPGASEQPDASGDSGQNGSSR